MPLQQTSGAASYDAFGGGAPIAAKYIEDFFQTWLRTGTGSSTTVTTGLNASINKSLVWTKSRSAATNHKLTDNVRGATKALSSNTTGAEVTDSQGLTAFSSPGYTIGTNTDYNNSGATYVDFQWVATPKFFDVVTYTGTQNSSGTGQVVNHNLGSTPGCIIIKPLSDTSGTGFSGLNSWIVYHRGLSSPTSQFLRLNLTNGIDGNNDKVRAVSDTTFTAGWEVGLSGIQYVAYVFAHNAGGFGLTGTDNVISCGSFTQVSGVANVTLGYEPQWVLIKRTNAAENWTILDNMRGVYSSVNTPSNALFPNTSGAESSGFYIGINATGFDASGLSTSGSYIYIAIRRGPMRTPTTGISVFDADYTTGGGTSGKLITTNFPVDASISSAVLLSGSATTSNRQVFDRLRGSTQGLRTNATDAESTLSAGIGFASNTAIFDQFWNTTATAIYWNFRRAPGFFDEVCYTGTGSARTVAHNLTVVPELMIVKRRSDTGAWCVYTSALGNTRFLELNTNYVATTSTDVWNDTTPTSSVFTVGVSSQTNGSGSTFVAYLFATCPGVSKVGTYTGTGTTQTINCGFTGGARFVLIKRNADNSDWYVWDSARGIVAGNDPYLLLNSTAAEVTSTDYVDTAATGFELSSTAPAALNANGGTYIFLAIS